jgi:hypothetical protein
MMKPYMLATYFCRWGRICLQDGSVYVDNIELYMLAGGIVYVGRTERLCWQVEPYMLAN